MKNEWHRNFLHGWCCREKETAKLWANFEVTTTPEAGIAALEALIPHAKGSATAISCINQIITEKQAAATPRCPECSHALICTDPGGEIFYCNGACASTIGEADTGQRYRKVREWSYAELNLLVT